jgi:hypothetical protein
VIHRFMLVFVMLIALAASANQAATAKAAYTTPLTCSTMNDLQFFTLNGGRRGVIAHGSSHCAIPFLIFHAVQPSITTPSGVAVSGGAVCRVSSIMPCEVVSRYIRGPGIGKKRVYYFTMRMVGVLPPGWRWTSRNMQIGKGGWTSTHCYGWGTVRVSCNYARAFVL